MKTIPRNGLLLGCLFTPLVCLAEVASPDPAPADQVVITATREKLMKLEKEVQLAEQRFYQRYNELNQKRDYAVKCYNEAETGTRFKKTYCQPVFASKAQEEQARRIVAYLGSNSTPATTSSAAYSMHQGAAMGIDGVAGGTNSGEEKQTLPTAVSEVPGVPAIMAVQGNQSDFQKNMVEITRKSPELVKLLNKYTELQKEYDALYRRLNGASPRGDDKPAVPTSPQTP